MPVRLLSKTFLALLLCAPIIPTGCAGLMAKNAYIESETQKYVFDEDPAAVLAAARQLLFSDGYTVTDSGPNAVETDWRLSDDGENRSRMLVQVLADDAGAQISAMYSRQALDSKGRWYGGSPARDARFELQVIEALDPDEGRRIRSGANAARDEARD